MATGRTFGGACMTETTSQDSQSVIQAALQRAGAAHRAGHLAEAEAQYRRVLARDERHVDALHMLGIIQAQRGHLPEAEQLIRLALTIDPTHADAYYNRGNILRELGRFEEAQASYQHALALRPDHVGAWVNRGIALFELGRCEDALFCDDRALDLSPDDALIHTNRGNALFKLGRLDEAIASHDRAVALKPNHAEAYLNRGAVLVEHGQPLAALDDAERAIALSPDRAQGYGHRGIVFTALKQWEQAVASYDQAIARDPKYIEAYTNRGHALMQLGRLDAALATYEKMIALRPDCAEGYYGRGTAAFARDQIDVALESFEQATVLNPDYANAHHNQALLRLLKGDFARGFEQFEWRWTNKDLVGRRRDFQQPLWTGGSDLAGKTILLHGEQGLGDAIQFCRYVPMVAAKGATIILEVAPALQELMQSVGGAARIIGFGERLPEFDCHCPLLSLPRAFRTRLESIPAEVPYLSPPVSAVQKWQGLLPAAKGLRIGLVWAGNPQHANDHNRSIGLPAMLPLLSHPGAAFISMQKQLRDGDAELLRQNPGLLHLGAELQTFADTAAVVSMLDLVISVDTSLVHLAGALAKPTWIVLPLIPDWRWLLDRADSPWYPTARLFRRSRGSAWDAVIADVGRALGDLSHSMGDRPTTPPAQCG